MTWDPAQYERFADERLRPAIELISRIGGDPRDIWDLGSGTGSVTRLLVERFPGAAIHGLDSSPEMLEMARRIPRVDWVEGDIVDWVPADPPDLVFSNATLHWLGDHGRLFPRLAETVATRGTFAVQMPRNFGEPSHLLLAEMAGSPRWRDRTRAVRTPEPVAEPSRYHADLRQHFDRLDIWETVYLQILSGPNPVAEWARGTALRPYLDVLGEAADDFVAEYTARLAAAYPALDDGTTPFPFRRLFIVGTR